MTNKIMYLSAIICNNFTFQQCFIEMLDRSRLDSKILLKILLKPTVLTLKNNVRLTPWLLKCRNFSFRDSFPTKNFCPLYAKQSKSTKNELKHTALTLSMVYNQTTTTTRISSTTICNNTKQHTTHDNTDNNDNNNSTQQHTTPTTTQRQHATTMTTTTHNNARQQQLQ